jgi:trimeric autotransporter adhesin
VLNIKFKSLILFSVFLFSLSADAQIFIPFSYYRCVLPASTGGDSLNADFLLGTTSNTTVSGSRVVLNSGSTSGTFTSRVFDITGACNALSYFKSTAWTSSFPAGKELPATSESSSDYSSVSASLMSNIQGLWHLNESVTGTAPGGTDFADSSGNGYHATRNSANITLGGAGRFANAVTNNGSGFIDLPTANTSISSTGSYTISVWYNVTSFTNGCVGSGSYFLDRNLSGGGNPLASICARNSSGSRFAFETRCDNGANLTQINGGLISTGTWQHIVIQRDRTAALYRIFTDGTQISTVGDGGGCTVTLDTFRLGRHATNGTGGLTGLADEFAVWNRALTAAEVLQLYRRGAYRLKFQFRTCFLSDCSDLPIFRGPNGTAATFFTEVNNNTNQVSSTGTVNTTPPIMTFTNFTTFGLTNDRYFQYRATFEGDNTSFQPDLKSVTIERN